MSDPEIADLPTSPRLHAYTSVWQLRGDAWASLADVTKRLSDAPHARRTAAGPAAMRSASWCGCWTRCETYWASLAAAGWSGSPRSATSADYESAMRMADTVTRVISGNVEDVVHARDRRRPSVGCGRVARAPVRAAGVPGPGRRRRARGRGDQLREEMRELRRARGSLHLRAALRSELRGRASRGPAELRDPGLRHPARLRCGVTASTATDLRRFIEDFDPQAVESLASAERMLLLGERSRSVGRRSTCTSLRRSRSSSWQVR